MDGPASIEVQEVILGFMRRAFTGEAALDSSSEEDEAWVVEFMGLADQVTPADVALWPKGKQWSLFTLLVNAVAAIETQRRAKGEFRFPVGFLQGSSPAELGRPLLRGLADALNRLPRSA